MHAATLQGFREIAGAMGLGGGWQWIGPHMSQRMFGISEARARAYAARHGGVAAPMAPQPRADHEFGCGCQECGGTATDWQSAAGDVACPRCRSFDVIHLARTHFECHGCGHDWLAEGRDCNCSECVAEAKLEEQP